MMRFAHPRRLAAAVVALAGAAGCGPDREWNPVVGDARVLVGTWRDGGATLTLRADGRYTCGGGAACGALGAGGTWARARDFYLAFRPAGGAPTVEWRITEAGGRYRLAAGRTTGDPDEWEPRLTFEQAERAA